MDYWVSFLSYKIFLLVIMVDLAVYAFLSPAGVEKQHGHTISSGGSMFSLVPSQVVTTKKALSISSSLSQQAATGGIEAAITADTHATNNHIRRKRPKRKPKKKKKSTDNYLVTPLSLETATTILQQQNNTIISKDDDNTQPPGFPTSGNYPDVHWRAINFDHLREHPRFEPLAHSWEIRSLNSLEDVRLFRQDSWQWDVLHHGRCTTSQAVAALGFLETITGEILGVPKVFRRGGIGAFHRLRQDAIRTLDDMNKVLCQQDDLEVVQKKERNRQSSVGRLWEQPTTTTTTSDAPRTFDCDYVYKTSAAEVQKRKSQARKQFQNEVSVTSVRMAWGNAQEATALLTALNYFAEKDPGFLMKESGMCGAGLTLNQTLSSQLLVGASPDAILCHSDGSIEALEVKNHCPFNVPWIKKGVSRSKDKFRVGDFPFDDGNDNIFAQYIPQLMMEMLCLGPDCKSVVMVRQTATKGALLLRLRRDDEWIEEMIFFLQRFQTEYVEKTIPPPRNFFWVDRDGAADVTARYRRFVNRTLEIRNTVEVITHIPHEKIQRVAEAAPYFLD